MTLINTALMKLWNFVCNILMMLFCRPDNNKINYDTIGTHLSKLNTIDNAVGFKRIEPNTIIIQKQSIVCAIFSKDIMNRPADLGLGDLFERWLGQCLGSMDSRDSRWGGLKKIYKPLFDLTADSDDLIDRLINEWDCTLVRLYESMKKTERSIEIDRIVDTLPLQFILNMVFGGMFLKDHEQIFNCLKIDAEILMFNVFNNKFAKNKLYRYIPVSVNTVNMILSRFNKNWSRILNLAEYSCTESLYAKLLENYRTYNRSYNRLSWESFSQTLVEIIFANQDVSVPSMCWLLTHYSLHPELNKKCLLDHYIEEAARMTPIFPTSMPKVTTKELIINGEIIGKGTTIIVDFFAMGYNLEWKMNDLNTFRSDRFADIDSSQFITRFGYGSRKCPGGNIANILFRKVLNHLRSKWIIVPDRPTSLSNIKLNPEKAFLTPVHKVWLAPVSHSNLRTTYYNCPPTAETTENRFLAVSINKRSPFLTDPEKANALVKYLSLNNTGTKTTIFICDRIAHFNLQAFDHMKPDRAKIQALKLGDTFVSIFRQAITLLGSECFDDHIDVCRWDDNTNILQIDDLVHLMSSDKLLDQRIDIIANRFLSHRGQNLIDTSYQSKIGLIKQYIYHEIPILVSGIYYNGLHYRTLYYCGTKEHLSKFAEDKNSLHRLIIDLVGTDEFKSIFNKIVSHSFSKVPKVTGFIGIAIDC